jgi:hypothetical protein
MAVVNERDEPERVEHAFARGRRMYVVCGTRLLTLDLRDL